MVLLEGDPAGVIGGGKSVLVILGRHGNEMRERQSWQTPRRVASRGLAEMGKTSGYGGAKIKACPASLPTNSERQQPNA